MSASIASPFTWGAGGEAMTPEEAKRRREIALAMIQQGTSAKPIQHWAQGAANVAQALMGAWDMNQTDKAERDARTGAKAEEAKLMAALAGGASPSAPSPQPMNINPQVGPVGAPSPSAGIGGGGMRSPGMAVVVSGKGYDTPEARSVYEAAVQAGLAPHQASAFAGAALAESRYNPNARNHGDGRDGTDSIGMFQWNSDRARGLQSYASKLGKDWRDRDVQLAYALEEMKGPESFAGQALRNAKTPEEATAAMLHYLRPGGYTRENPMAAGSASARLANTSAIMGLYGNGSAAQPAASGAPVQTAQANVTAPAQSSSAPPQAQIVAAMATLNNPYATPGAKAVAQALMQRAVTQETKDPRDIRLKDLTIAEKEAQAAQAQQMNPLAVQEKQLGIRKAQRDLDGEGYQLDMQSKRLANQQTEKNLQDKPEFREIGKDSFGNPIMGFVDQRGQKVTPYQPPTGQQPGQAITVPGPDGKPVEVPPGMDPKVFRETLSKRAADQAAGPKQDDVTGLRKEVQQLPSYKNISQAAPIYKSMVDTAGRNTKASDLNLVYGLGKIMDPTSVVREGEMIMVKNTAGLSESVIGYINAINGGQALTPETRKAIMAEAHSRMNAYKQMYDQDTGFYHGIIDANGMKREQVVPNFGEFAPWAGPSPKAGTPDNMTPRPVAPQPNADGWTVIDGARIRVKP